MTHVKTLPDPNEFSSVLRSLTPRQREVLSMAAGGLTTTEIGERLSLPKARVNAYLKAAWQRLGGGVARSTGDRSSRVAGQSEVGRLRGGLGLSQERFARLVGVSPRTVARWEAAGAGVVPEPAAADRLAFLADVHDLGAATFGVEGLRRFVESRQPLLEGRRVIDVLEGERRLEVLGLLHGIAGGGPA
jgi:DNA-binding CsgD family transcriptional regulator/transcriptional regulator with XRE-family HTH domain